MGEQETTQGGLSYYNYSENSENKLMDGNGIRNITASRHRRQSSAVVCVDAPWILLDPKHLVTPFEMCDCWVKLTRK